MFFPFTKKWQARIEKLATDLFCYFRSVERFSINQYITFIDNHLMPNQSSFNAKPISI